MNYLVVGLAFGLLLTTVVDPVAAGRPTYITKNKKGAAETAFLGDIVVTPCCSISECYDCFQEKLTEDPFCVLEDQFCGCSLSACEAPAPALPEAAEWDAQVLRLAQYVAAEE